jgi:hypothetical protein
MSHSNSKVPSARAVLSSRIVFLGLAVVLIAAVSATTSVAANLVTSKDIKDYTIQGKDIKEEAVTTSRLKQGAVTSYRVKDKSLKYGDFTDKAISKLKGNTGPKGPSGLEGAYYATAKYDVGNTNQTAIATVACKAQTDVAISGGVQMIGVGGVNAAVGSSFPGRMNFSTSTPIANRLDGWIIQFDADVNPGKVTVWALCVPGASIPVVNTYTQSSG